MYLALFTLAYLFVRKYRAIPFLLLAFIVFGFAGLPRFGDFFWFFTEIPYGEHGSELYGSGSFWEYFNHADRIVGLPVAILLVAGTVVLLFRLFRKGQKVMSTGWVTLYILVIPAFWGFVLAQSILWWQGMFAVLFSYRFMVCVMPLAAILAAASFDLVQRIFSKYSWIHYLIAAALLFLIIRTTLRMHRIPFQTDQGRITIAEAADWISNLEVEYGRIFYFDPSLVFYLDMDPFDRSLSIQNLSDKENPHNNLEPGDLLVFDPHFGGFENRVPLENIEGSPYFDKLAEFNPDPPYMAPGDVPYHVSVYQRRYIPAEPIANIIIDFEDATVGTSNENVYKGLYSQKLNPSREYSIAIEVSAEKLNESELLYLEASAKIWTDYPEDHKIIILVLSIHAANHTTLEYFSVSAESISSDEVGWLSPTISYDLTKAPKDYEYMKIYIWYRGENEVYVDNLKVVY
jgi:hypothetical protein